MDPNANLQEQERILARQRLAPGDRVRLHELREALTAWVRGGGFEPEWATAPSARKYFGR